MTRREAREAVFSLLFETEFRRDEDTTEIFAVSCEERELIPNEYNKKVYHGVHEHCEELDAKIQEFSIGWDVSRISRLTRTIMQLAIFEILYMEDIPTGVAISEAVRLAKMYDGDDTGAFVNGILGAFARHLSAEV